MSTNKVRPLSAIVQTLEELEEKDPTFILPLTSPSGDREECIRGVMRILMRQTKGHVDPVFVERLINFQFPMMGG